MIVTIVEGNKTHATIAVGFNGGEVTGCDCAANAEAARQALREALRYLDDHVVKARL